MFRFVFESKTVFDETGIACCSHSHFVFRLLVCCCFFWNQDGCDSTMVDAVDDELCLGLHLYASIRSSFSSQDAGDNEGLASGTQDMFGMSACWYPTIVQTDNGMQKIVVFYVFRNEYISVLLVFGEPFSWTRKEQNNKGQSHGLDLVRDKNRFCNWMIGKKQINMYRECWRFFFFSKDERLPSPFVKRQHFPICFLIFSVNY